MRPLFLLFALLTSNAYGIDYIRTHHETVPAIGSDATRTTPDPASADESFRVNSGQTVRITGNESCKDIYVNGFGDAPAVLELTNGCELRVQTILLGGPQAILRTPPGQAVRCRVVWRSLPFDILNDPQQFGNGLISISGQLLLSGENPRESIGEVSAELKAGDRTIALPRAPPAWRAGDELWIPDTRQPVAGQTSQTESAVIRSIGGNTVTLTAPLEFDHLGWHRQDGTLGELFEVANVTQPIVFQSESLTDKRGHAIFMDHCRIEVSGLTLREMGRTTGAPLHSTVWTPGQPASLQQIGTNQIGRYAFHLHGMPGRMDAGEWQVQMRHFSIVGSPKLGLVLHHASHFGLYENFAIVDCSGGALTTETPNVYGNRFANGIIIGKRPGTGLRLTDRAGRNVNGGDHWHPTTGLALQSAMNEFHDIGIYSVQEGIGLVGFRTSILYRPLRRGEHETSTNRQNILTLPYRYPFLPSSNVRVWGCWRGIETWTADCHENTERMFPGLTIIHTRNPTDFEDQQETWLEGYRILGDFAQVVTPTSTANPGTYGLHWKGGYRFGITVNGGEVRGYDVAYDLVHDENYTRFLGVTFECPCINYLPIGRVQRNAPGAEWEGLWEDCEFLPVNGARQFINGQYPKYDLRLSYNHPNRPEIHSLHRLSYAIRPWHDGRDLDTYHYESDADFSVKPIVAPNFYGDWPPGVNSQRQLIELGTPIYGQQIPPTAFQNSEEFGPFWADDVTLENRLRRIEERLDALEAE